MFKTTLLFYICLQTFVAQKLSKAHHRQTLYETSNNQPIARLFPFLTCYFVFYKPKMPKMLDNGLIAALLHKNTVR